MEQPIPMSVNKMWGEKPLSEEDARSIQECKRIFDEARAAIERSGIPETQAAIQSVPQDQRTLTAIFERLTEIATSDILGERAAAASIMLLMKDDPKVFGYLLAWSQRETNEGIKKILCWNDPQC
jgi:hypothetical protein